MRHFAFALVMTFCGMPLQGATLERLSFEQMAAQSTSIVRARVTGSFGQLHGALVYTHYTVLVSERYKGTPADTIQVSVPGGTANGIRQEVPGAPRLNAGEEYVFFLWTGKSGATQVIGLTQGLFSVGKTAEADPSVVRNASTELMLDRATGQVVKDERLQMRLSQLRARIATSLPKGPAR